MTRQTEQTQSGYRDVLRVCLPLVLGMSATTVMEFTDRIFLSNYSIEAISAVVPAGITAYLFLAFLGGITGYAGVFIAQYFGSGSTTRIGAVLWQGIYFTLFSALVCWLLAILATGPIFTFAGHADDVRLLEEVYFSILCKGAFLHIAVCTLSTFFTGRGITRPVMIITLIGVGVNIPLDYALIYGKWGLPELGVTGAATATVMAWGVNFLLLAVLTFTPQNNKDFGVFSAWQIDWKLLLRLLHFGIPGSLQFTLDILAFTIFILLVGRIGTEQLAATNIVLSINAVAFMPSMGVSQGITVMVGQALGRKNILEAQTSVRKAIHLLLAYIICIDLLFIFLPEPILTLFIREAGGAGSINTVMDTGIQLLRIISAYLLLDALYMVFSGALKGAGDTRFLMFSIGISSLFCLILPVYFGINHFGMGVQAAWSCVLLFIIVLFLLSAGRYKTGKWKKMLVIEKEFQKQ
jgi:multidrug resistance protein, MATE family